jgi:hypothetical protein
MLIGSTGYFIVVWGVLLAWAFAIAGLVVAAVLRRNWIPLALAAGVGVGGILFTRAVLDAIVG